ncbi:UDP-glucuronosyltransferase 2C1-like isoform X2 [Patiria miniata]|uniref:UDP-glucuronosyltransferase n=1 Tax=Patiria miniata TaxID=46514 RepID=A0A914ABM2_PATMI|nr:UDP-glucuronosyltransferase 2C1-like isoform X2 [Patiria miniata]
MGALYVILFCCLSGHIVLFRGVALGSRILYVTAGGIGSHYPSSVGISKALVRRGHHVTVAIDQGSYDKGEDGRYFPPNMDIIPFQRSLSLATSLRCIDKYVRSALRGCSPNDVIDELPPPDYPGQDDHTFSDLNEGFCNDILNNTELIAKLSASNYDMIIGDSVFLCYVLLSQKLSVPFIHFGLTSMVPSQHDIFAGNPVSPAYVPERASELTDQLTFRQRFKNTLMYHLVRYFYNKLVLQTFEIVQQRHSLRPDVTFQQLIAEAEMWIFSSNFLVDFARPLPPHVRFVGGVLTGPPSQLNKELDVFANSSGEAGLVVVTMGTLITSQLTEQQSQAMATSLSLLPQKVVWAFSGRAPSAVGNNTLIVARIPQNDLLAHPKVRAFVSHGGLNSLHESVYHGVPVVCVPVFGDQGDNCVRLRTRGMAVKVDIKNLMDTTLYEAITEIIQNQRYKDTAVIMSQIAKDRVSGMSPVDETAYWIEYAIKHGTQHLKPRALQLSFIEYFMLDVLAINVVIVIAIIVGIKYTCCSRKVEVAGQ